MSERTSAGAAVVVVGAVNVDRVLTVERLPRPGESVIAAQVLRAHGGKGANQAVAAAGAGARTWLVACVGSDADGEGALAHLAARGVEVAEVARDGEAPTGLAVVTTASAERENQIVAVLGANARLDPGHVRAAVGRALAGAGPGPAPTVLVSLGVPDAAVVAAAQAAREHGARLVLVPAPFRALPAELSAGADDGVLLPNEHEARRLLGCAPADPDALRRAWRASPAGAWGALVVTLGARGAALVSADDGGLVPAPAVDAVDTTGAGDAFAGTLAAALSAGAGLRDAVGRAVEAAAQSTRHRGAQPPA
jgi:ribokinase